MALFNAHLAEFVVSILAMFWVTIIIVYFHIPSHEGFNNLIFSFPVFHPTFLSRMLACRLTAGAIQFGTVFCDGNLKPFD